MGKYLYPVYDDDSGDLRIETVVANNLSQAKDKIAKKYFNKYDDLQNDSFDELITELFDEHNIYIGDVYDIEEL